MLESWKHCVASGCTEAAAAKTVLMGKKTKNKSQNSLHMDTAFSTIHFSDQVLQARPNVSSMYGSSKHRLLAPDAV